MQNRRRRNAIAKEYVGVIIDQLVYVLLLGANVECIYLREPFVVRELL